MPAKSEVVTESIVGEWSNSSGGPVTSSPGEPPSVKMNDRFPAETCATPGPRIVIQLIGPSYTNAGFELFGLTLVTVNQPLSAVAHVEHDGTVGSTSVAQPSMSTFAYSTM